jgi:nucleotide-binding universal stress UspA family protein
MRIIVAYDGSRGAEAAVDEVLRRPWPEGSEIRVVTVVETPAPYPPAAGVEAYAPVTERIRAMIREEMEGRVRKVVQRFKDRPELRVGYELREPGVKRALLDAIREWRADLVVLGSQGTTALGRLFLGSVSHALVTHAPCNVEIVKVGEAA